MPSATTATPDAPFSSASRCAGERYGVVRCVLFFAEQYDLIHSMHVFVGMGVGRMRRAFVVKGVDLEPPGGFFNFRLWYR